MVSVKKNLCLKNNLSNQKLYCIAASLDLIVFFLGEK